MHCWRRRATAIPAETCCVQRDMHACELCGPAVLTQRTTCNSSTETHLPRLWWRGDGSRRCCRQALQHGHVSQAGRTAHGERPERCCRRPPAVPEAQRMQQQAQRTLQWRVDGVVKPSCVCAHQPCCCRAHVRVAEERSHPAVGAAHCLKQPQQQLLLLLGPFCLAIAAVGRHRAAAVPAHAPCDGPQAEERTLHLLPTAC